MTIQPRTGIDIGGTKLEAAVLDADGMELARERVPTPEGYAAILDAVAELVATTECAAGAKSYGVGVGAPGSLSPRDGRIRNANSVHLNGQRLDLDLEDRIGRPVRLDNDANCFAMAEARAGAGQGKSTVFGVILGTGVGAGIVVDHRILTGANRIGGEWGHNPLPRPNIEEVPGPDCYCGRRGCIETWCAGPSLAADHFRTTGSELDPGMIVEFAAAGELTAQETLDRHLDRLARGLAGVVNILDPDVIVLGGGLSNLDHLYTKLPDAMRPLVFSDSFETPILRNHLGDSAGVIGAAWICPTSEAA
ncbi:MAG: ROK family protein [Paracoccaceae bacterium]